MGRRNSHGSISRKVKSRGVFPQIYVDREADFASIKLAPGIEKKSYIKDGFAICENDKGQIIEIQVLNLSELKKISNSSARNHR